MAPGDRGVLNAMAPGHFDASGLADVEDKPAITWVRAMEDQVISDTSAFDLAFLGQLGAVPGWPGADTMPPQPMHQQMQAVLDRYAANGGEVRVVVPGELCPRRAARGPAGGGGRDHRAPVRSPAF